MHRGTEWSPGTQVSLGIQVSLESNQFLRTQGPQRTLKFQGPICLQKLMCI